MYSLSSPKRFVAHILPQGAGGSRHPTEDDPPKWTPAGTSRGIGTIPGRREEIPAGMSLRGARPVPQPESWIPDQSDSGLLTSRQDPARNSTCPAHIAGFHGEPGSRKANGPRPKLRWGWTPWLGSLREPNLSRVEKLMSAIVLTPKAEQTSLRPPEWPSPLR